VGVTLPSTHGADRTVAIALTALLALVFLGDLAWADDVDEAHDVDEVIVVTGTRTETPLASSPVHTEVVDRAHLEESGAETVAEALAFRPGLWLERGIAGTGVSIQGLGPEYVLVLVDGQRQIGRVGGAIDLERIAVGDVERIEIVRGPSSALYGADALGGVVNIVRRAPEAGTAGVIDARIDGRLATDLRARVESASQRWWGGAGTEWRRGDAFDRTPGEPSTTLSAYDDLRGGGRGGWRPGARTDVEVGGEYGRRDLQGVSASATGAVFDRRNLIETASAQALSRWRGDATVLRASLGVGTYRDQYLDDQRDSSALDRNEETRESLGEASAGIERVVGRHRVTAGVDGLREALTADRLAMPGLRWRGAVYAQDEWRIGDEYRWLVVPAVRVDHDSQFDTHATPRLAVRWDPTDRVALRASSGMGFRAPSFKELLLRFENPGVGYVVEGNPALRPEQSVSAQLGGEWRPRASVWLAASTFHNELENLIASVTLDDGGGAGGPIRFGYDNIGRARTQGVEGWLLVERGRLGAELGYAYTRARDVDARRALEGVPAQRASAALRWRDRAEAFTASLEAVVTGPRPFYLSDDPADVMESDPRLEARARIARRFAAGLTFYLGVENLLDAGDDRFDPIAPRTLYAGVTARR
jgi:outer membrane receptor for ferrienterochelin and colicins